MIWDYENQLAAAQVFTVSAVSASSYAKGTAAQDLSIGERMSLLVYVEAAASGGASWAYQAIQADDAALTTNIDVLATVTVADATAIKGAFIEIPFPLGTMSRKYLGFRAVPTGGTTPTMTLSVYLMPQEDIPKYKSFPKVVNPAV